MVFLVRKCAYFPFGFLTRASSHLRHKHFFPKPCIIPFLLVCIVLCRAPGVQSSTPSSSSSANTTNTNDVDGGDPGHNQEPDNNNKHQQQQQQQQQQHKWPLRPGVQVHVNGQHNLNNTSAASASRASKTASRGTSTSGGNNGQQHRDAVDRVASSSKGKLGRCSSAATTTLSIHTRAHTRCSQSCICMLLQPTRARRKCMAELAGLVWRKRSLGPWEEERALDFVPNKENLPLPCISC